MKNSCAVFCCACLFALPLARASEPDKGTGAISGRILPKDASVRIIAKLAGTDHSIKGNIKGEVTLAQGGDFTIKDLPPGKYDLIFLLRGESEKKYRATRWSEVVVGKGETTSGVNYRLTPHESPHLIDEILVGFAGVNDADARKTILKAGCIVKNAPLLLGGTTVYSVDIPDNKSVSEMIALFEQEKGVKYAEPDGIVTMF